MERFECGTRIIAGSGAVRVLAEMGIRRLFLVTDPYFVKNGTTNRLLELSGAAETAIFDRVVPDPTVALAAEGTALLREFRPDTVVALGGGSAMDCAKAMTYFAGGDIRVVAIPTTSGSGSEVTDFAILTHDRVKHPLVDSRLRPKVAILDDALLENLPPALIADTGFDVLTHAAEAFVAGHAGAVTDALAREAFCSCYALLPASFAGRKELRLRVHQAATMAGMAFTQAGLGLCHALSHALGGIFHVPHGRLNAILLPAVIATNAHAAAGKYATLARAAGLGGSADTVAVRALRSGLIRLRGELKLPDTLLEAGIAPRELWAHMDAVVQATLADPCCETNPLKVEDFMVRRILEEVTGRG